MYLRLFLVIIVNTILISRIDSFTLLDSQINNDLVLYARNSPYLAIEDIVVSKKSRLIIEPGTEIRFDKGRQLIVHGILIANGTQLDRIKLSKFNNEDYLALNLTLNKNVNIRHDERKLRLVEGESMLDGKLQVFYNSKWHYVCSTQLNWTEVDANVTCKSMGYSNGTFYNYAPSNNLTSHMKIFLPQCTGREQNLFECIGTKNPELGLSVCEKQNSVGLVCEGFDNYAVSGVNNWAGIVFQRNAPVKKIQEFSTVFYNVSQSSLHFVDISFAGLIRNKNNLKPKYDFLPTSAIIVYQFAPTFNNITIEHSIGNGLNYSNIEAPGSITNSIFRNNRGHGIVVKSRFGNIKMSNVISRDNLGDGLKYEFNNTIWSQQEQEEYFTNRYIQYCDSQNPLSYPAYYRYKNPNYVYECIKTFSTEPHMRITLHFQKIKILSEYSTYWLEVYDGQTDKNPLIANYTFQNGKTPEAIYSRSNYMFVKIKYQCNFASGRQLQPIEINKIRLEHQWNQMKENQMVYGQNLFRHSPPIGDHMPLNNLPMLPLEHLSDAEKLKNLQQLDKNLNKENLKFEEKINEKNVQNAKTRIACPYTDLDDITMYAMIGPSKNADLLIKNSQFVNNSFNGINATNLHSLVQLNQSLISNNYLNGLHVQAGAGDISLYQSEVSSNSMNGINITYSGGLKEFNYSRIHNNALYGIYINFNVEQEFDNVFQNTTLNSSLIELNMLGGVYIGAYCNQSNITVNSSVFLHNQENGLLIDSCDQDRWFVQYTPDYGFKQFLNRSYFFTNLNVSWNLFDSNRLNGIKINALQNMIGIVTNNTFQNHKKGAMLITANNSRYSINRNVSLLITNNLFRQNSGRYCINIGLNNLADIKTQSINVTFNHFKDNVITEPYEHLTPRSWPSAVAVVSSKNIKINFNIFDNPNSLVELATGLNNYTSQINASFNWFASLQPVYDLHYFMSHKEKCNQQWVNIRNAVFDNSNRSNLAQIIYWPFSCNQRMWYFESSSDLAPPANFDLSSTNNLGGVYDLADSILPSNKYTVVNDIFVKPGAKLTIKSGAELNFLNGVGILVLGELNIEGHLGAQVKLTTSHRNNRFIRSINQTNLNQTKNFTTPIPPLTKQKAFTNSFRLELVDGRNSIEGRLRVEINGKYGTVCNKAWTIQNSKIVCQQMGLILDPNFYIYYKKLFNDHRSNEAILMSEVQCDGLDTNLFECRHTSPNDHTCTHEDDVWLKCLRPSWAGIRFGMASEASKIKYALFQQSGQYDYNEAQLAAALHFDLLRHELSNLTFEQNQHISMQVVFNQPTNIAKINNLNFGSNYGPGLVTRTGYITVNQLNAINNLIHPVFEINPYMDADLLSQVRLFSAEPRRGIHVRQELTRIRDNKWFIGAEQMVFIYTDTEYEFGPVEFNIQIKTDNDRVLIVELVDFNPNVNEEQIIFCERLCQNDYRDLSSRQWNMSIAETLMYFPLNTSYSVLNINYNVTTHKSGRLSFIVYSTKAPQIAYDYRNPTNTYIRNLMPENVIKINNSTFFSNRHSIVMRHYDESLDIFGNLRKSFTSNDQIFWMNTDPHNPKINPRVLNLTFHVMNSLGESNKDDFLIGESGYQIYDLVPNVKKGPLSRINITFENSVFELNYGGIRSIYRYHEYSNSIFNYEIRNNKFTNNHQSMLKIFLPRIYRFASKNHYQNFSHTLNIRNNQFSFNSLFGLSIDGYYAQINITKNQFNDNQCRLGLVKLSGSEKHFFIYSNRIYSNTASFIFDLEATSHADNSLDYPSLLVENEINSNVKPQIFIKSRDLSKLLAANYAVSYTIALRGIQNCTINKNYLENSFDYELVGALATNTLNTSIDATYNYWGTSDSNVVSDRIFDFKNWNNHAIVNYLPFISDKVHYSLSKRAPNETIFHNAEHILGGVLKHDLTLSKLSRPYQVVADVTVLPGRTLYINPGVEIEFYPNVGILVLGDLRASGRHDAHIKMRPVQKLTKTKSDLVQSQSIENEWLQQYLKIRFFDGLDENQGFLQIYNDTLRSWTFTCDPQLTIQTASIVCKQMSKEHRNPLVHSIYYYFHPIYQPAVWNQSFVCQGGESHLAECDSMANFNFGSCDSNGEYTYIMCGDYNLNEKYEHGWAGVRFAQSHYEMRYEFDEPNDRPVYPRGDFHQEKQDSSYMYYVDIVGAGKLHNKPHASLQLIYRTPLISNCNIMNSSYHGLEFMQSKVTSVMNKLKINWSLGYAINTLQMNSQTTDQKSSFQVLNKNSLSSSSLFSLVDICDPHKYYDLEQRIILFYRYSDESRDCGKIFRTRLSSTLNAKGKIAIRFVQFSLINNTVLNDSIQIYLNKNKIVKWLSNSSSMEHLNQLYTSQSDSLSVFITASPGREYYGFVAEVLLFPTSQYLLSDTYIELSDSEFANNQLGAVSLSSAGERNPSIYLVRNRFVANGIRLFNTSSQPMLNLIVQNSPKFNLGNNYVANNYGGCHLQIYSGSGVLITNSIIYNNLFHSNRNATALSVAGPLNLPYNELLVDKNFFVENETPRTDLISIVGVVSKFSRNQIVYNKAARILFTKGFENVSTPRSQDTSFNLFRYNLAYGIVNNLDDPNRFRSTMVAASLKQVYYSNYLFNKDNDFELSSLVDPVVVEYMQSIRLSTSTLSPPFRNDHNSKSPLNLARFTRTFKKDNLYGMVAHTGVINATHNYWGSVIDTEIRGRIRDKYDNETLFEVFYQPAVDEFKLRDGKCELGWTLIDDTCYTYVGSYVVYDEAKSVCKNFESRLARETVAPIKLPRLRRLARSSQYDYETQSYRKMWLHTEHFFANQNSPCSIIDDFGTGSMSCDQRLPFICEKDPVFTSATFRFKDELAFAIAALAALILCVIVLSLLWAYKSTRRKKEHIDRQNTLRTSARTNRHMINSGFSSLKTTKSGSNLYNSDYSVNERTMARSIAGTIYNSQRNQYFMNNRKQKHKCDQIDPSQQWSTSPSFSGLDSTPVSYTNFANLKHKLNQSVQYHDFDASPIKYGELDEANDTITDELSDETGVTKLDSNRFKSKSISPKSNLSEGLLEKDLLHAKFKKQPESIDTGSGTAIQSAYDQLMNNTINDTDEDLMDSRRLLTNKINTSTMLKQSGLTKSDDDAPTLSEYENLSSLGTGKVVQSNCTARPVFSKRNFLPVAQIVSGQPPPPPPKNYPPQLLPQFKPLNPSDTDDTDSLMSAQLITSASLLMNRDTVKEAKRIADVQTNVPHGKKVPSFNPRNLKTHAEVYKSHDVDVQSSDFDADANKPPPMETAI